MYIRKERKKDNNKEKEKDKENEHDQENERAKEKEHISNCVSPLAAEVRGSTGGAEGPRPVHPGQVVQAPRHHLGATTNYGIPTNFLV